MNTSYLDDKNKEWFDEFDQKAYSMILAYQYNKNIKGMLGVAKTWNVTRKYREKKYGKIGIKKTKLLQFKTVLNTFGSFTKPLPFTDIESYNGTLINHKNSDGELLE